MTDGEKAAFALCSSYTKGVEWTDNPDGTIRSITIHHIPLNTDEQRSITLNGPFTYEEVPNNEIE